MAVFAPMPSASVSTATAVKPGWAKSIRMPYRQSWTISSSSLLGCSDSASQNALALRRSRSSLFRQSRRSQSASCHSRYCSSVSHSWRQSARRRRGTITPTSAISHRCGRAANRARWGFNRTVQLSGPRRLRSARPRRLRLFEQAVAFDGFGERLAARARQLVVLARRPRLGARDAFFLPDRGEVAGVLEPAQRRVDRAAGQAGDVDDVEPVSIPIGDRLEDDGGRVSEKGSGHAAHDSVASKLSRQYSTYHLTQGLCKCSVQPGPYCG